MKRNPLKAPSKSAGGISILKTSSRKHNNPPALSMDNERDVEIPNTPLEFSSSDDNPLCVFFVYCVIT